MSINTGRIDKNISGDLINKFGKNMPIPFIESVSVMDAGIEVTLSMYFSVTNEQLLAKNKFVDSIRATGINVYFMMLVDSNADYTAGESIYNYDYSKFLKNLNKNTPDSHILNYVSAHYKASPETFVKPSLEIPYSSAGHGLGGVSFLYPQSKSNMTDIESAGLAGAGGLPFIKKVIKIENVQDLFDIVQTNTYKIPIENFRISEMVYSREETPILKLSATTTIGDITRNIITTFLPAHPSSAEILIYDTGPAFNSFFGAKNYLSHGITKMGLVSFTSLFDNLQTEFSHTTGVQAAFRSTDSRVNFYKSFVSDVSHVELMNMGNVLISDTTIFEDINENLVESSEVIQSINSQFYANDKIKLEDILEGLNELIIEPPDSNEAKTLINSLSYILSEFGTTMDLLPQLNKFRSQIPNRPTTTQEGRFYENLKIKIYNANQVVMEGRKLKRLVIKNPIVKDLRNPMVATEEYKQRNDILIARRAEGDDMSYKYNSVEGSFLSRGKDFIPFIYLHGHEFQGQVGLDPTFNPMSVPASFQMPPYFSSNETRTSTFMGDTAYGKIIDTIEQYYLKGSIYSYAKTDPRFSTDTTVEATALNDKFKNFETFAGAELGSINEYLKELTGKSRFDKEVDTYLGDTNYDIDNFELDSNAKSTIANNNFTLVENGHFSFDYEKALGLFSNISLGLNTKKIDDIFGRDLLQSRFKVKRVRVDIHAKLVSKGDDPVYDVLSEDNYETYDSSPVVKPELESAKIPHSHIRLGSIVAEFKDVENGNPVTTNCKVHKPAYLDDLVDYQKTVDERMGGFADDSYSLGKQMDYSLHKNFVKKEILTGYTLGKPSVGEALPYNTYYNQAVLIDEDWDTTIFGLAVNDQVVSVEKTHSYIALRNIGSIYNVGNDNYVIRQYSHTAGSAPPTDNYGKPLASALSDGDITEEESGMYFAYSLRNSLLSFPPITDAASAPNYRLMTFEFQKVGIIKEEILSETSLGAGGFANLLAFRAGILPEQVEQYVNRQFYEFFIEVEDTTYGVYRFIRDDLLRVKTAYKEYAKDCESNCSFNDLTLSFNEFFVNGIEARFAEAPESAPWIRAPLLYAMHQDLLFNAFKGDLNLMRIYAASLSEQLSPRNGNLKSILKFMEKLNSLWDSYYSETSGIVDIMIEKFKGPTKIRFGRHPDEGDAETSGYTLMPNPYTYNGYSAQYQFDLHDGFKVVGALAFDGSEDNPYGPPYSEFEVKSYVGTGTGADSYGAVYAGDEDYTTGGPM